MKVYLTWNKNPVWVFHILLREITDYFEEEHNAECFRKEGGTQYIDSIDYTLGDCELIIYDDENDILKAVSYGEWNSGLRGVFEQRNNEKDLLVCMHTKEWGVYDIQSYNDRFAYTFKNTNFYPYSPEFDYDTVYTARQNLSFDDMIDKMFFRCTTGRSDEFKLADLGLTNERFPVESLENYLHRSITYKVGLSLAGVTEICHRDIEYMAIGLPILRLEFTQKYNPELIPNYHYIAVSTDGLSNDSNVHKIGGDEYIERFRARFDEVKKDQSTINNISINARKYYEDNCAPDVRVKKILEKLNYE